MEKYYPSENVTASLKVIGEDLAQLEEVLTVLNAIEGGNLEKVELNYEENSLDNLGPSNGQTTTKYEETQQIQIKKTTFQSSPNIVATSPKEDTKKVTRSNVVSKMLKSLNHQVGGSKLLWQTNEQ